MAWSMFSESIKKNVCRYLLQRYLGQFLYEDITLEQLSVDIYNGKGSVTDLILDVEALNCLVEKQNIPFQFIDGTIDKLSVQIPWSSLLTNPSMVEVEGLVLTLQPKETIVQSEAKMSDSMCSTSSSMHTAEQSRLQQDDLEFQDNRIEGLEVFAEAIESILNRIEVHFKKTLIRIEYLPRDCLNGVRLEIQILNIDYLNEVTKFSDTNEVPNSPRDKQSTSFNTSKIFCDGVSIYTDEFANKDRLDSRSSIKCDCPNNDPDFVYSNYCQNNRVLFGKLSGRQEFKVTLKQGSCVQGPKIELDINLGSLIVFSSPRQIHLLSELVKGFKIASNESSGSASQHSRTIQKPMSSLDYKIVEQQLLNHMENNDNSNTKTFKGLQNMQGWSSDLHEGNGDSDEEFYPAKGIRSKYGTESSRNLSDSICSEAASLDGSVTSYGSSASFFSKAASEMFNTASQTSSPSRYKSKLKGSSSDSDPNSESLTFHVRIGSVIVVLLHEDIMTVSPESFLLAPGSVADMSIKAKLFFKIIAESSNYGSVNFCPTREVFQKACQFSHLRLLSTSLIIEGDEKTTSSSKSLSVLFTTATLEVLECLVERSGLGEEDQTFEEYLEILKFLKKDSNKETWPSSLADHPIPVTSETDFWLHLKRSEKFGKSRSHAPLTEISCSLNQCWTEIDISIIDRISAVLNPYKICKPIVQNANIPTSPQTSIYHNVESTFLVDTKYDLKIKTPFILVKIKIPIPDLRPIENINRTHYWKRSLRDEELLLHLFDFQLSTAWSTSCSVFEYNVESKEINAFLKEVNSPPVQFARVIIDNKNKNTSLLDGGQVFGLPRLKVRINPWQKPSDLDDSDNSGNEKDDPASMIQSIRINTPAKEPSPFCSNPNNRPSLTCPETHKVEEYIIPGSPKEMAEFRNVALEATRIELEINVPCIAIHFPSKRFYETLYNRVNSDLLMWKPSAPERPYYDINDHSGIDPSVFSNLRFSSCKSGHYDDDDDDDKSIGSENEDFYGSKYYSTWDSNKFNPSSNKLQGQSKIAISVNVGSGKLNARIPLKSSQKDEKVSTIGEFLILFRGVNLFTVSGYQGQPHNNYICFQINYFNFLHNGNVNQKSFARSSSYFDMDFTRPPPNHLSPTIYKTEKGGIDNPKAVLVGTGADSSKNMLSLALKTHFDENGEKIVLVSCGIRGATLRHKMTKSNQTWFNQLLSFFEVADLPVPGYTPPVVVTELYQHLWDCAIDYRPLKLNLSSVLTINNLIISSNMIRKTNSSLLTFVAEEVSLYLSDKVPFTNAIDLKNNYICVVDVGSFELSVHLAENPRVDLRASNDRIHIHTCYDSASALGKLISHIASNGDLLEDCSDDSFEDHILDEQSSEVNQQLFDNVRNIMDEVMKEVVEEPISESNVENKEECDEFLFPGEKEGVVGIYEGRALDKPRDDWAVFDDSDGDFEILDYESSMRTLENDVPIVKILSTDPIIVIDNYFRAPTDKVDPLKAPSSYPPPVLKYSLREMTVVWHMYGGKDFEKEVSKKKQVQIVESHVSPYKNRQISPYGHAAIMYDTKNPQEFQFNINQPITGDSSKRIPANWKERGGKGRKHDVLMELQLNKIKFLYEVYGKQCVQASRQVLTIQDVEIRDRLASSNINKFLYQYTSESMPKQTLSNMVSIRAVFIRAEKLKREECCLKVTALPLRLNIDQDSLLFLIDFFNDISGTSNDDEQETAVIPQSPKAYYAPPIMGIKTQNEKTLDFDENFIINKRKGDYKSSSSTPVFIRSFVFAPEVHIKLDYEGKRVDMTHGSLAGLLMGLASLSCSVLKLKRVEYNRGIRGFHKLISFVLNEWFADIKQNQLPNLIGGVGPIHSLVQLFQGIIDLIRMPIEQYQKDGRIVRGLQRGANSFTTSTAMAALEITTRLVQALQSVAETAYDLVSPGPSVKTKKKSRKHRTSQPADLREGFSNAIMVVKEGIGETARTLVDAASTEHEAKGTVGAVGGVLRQLPPTVVAPLILATEATSNLLGGVRSQLVPDIGREHRHKYRDGI